jgi:hypothetical protein
MCESGLALEKSGAGAPEEIEVSEAMIEAGFRASKLYDREDPPDWEMAAVYRAMEAERRRSMVTDPR